MATEKPAQNKYCKSSDLSNEASVESFFVLRLLADLGYEDSEICPKKAVDELTIAKGRKRELYRPDYLLVCKKEPRWIIDAKSVDERIEDWTYQCAGYSLAINRRYKEKPLHFYMLTNGLLTRVYWWDQEDAVLSLRFSDFVDANPKYEALRRLLGADVMRASEQRAEHPKESHLLTRPSIQEVKRAFERCHRIIWESENMGPQGAFVEFAKLLFVKLWEDRRIRDNPILLARIGSNEPLPAQDVRFSTRWIDEQTANTPNPMDALLFRQLVTSLEQEITGRRRKRIFEQNEPLGISPGTVKQVVAQLEHYYLFGIDEDLNGRMFETFLTATMRGKELGQFFTPRSVVKLMVRLAKPLANPGHGGIERVIDACCGTGGFLIEALTEMRRQIWENRALTKTNRDALLEEISNRAIFGIDAGRKPEIARIARINMYLHGDGGSRVYLTDGLCVPPSASGADSVEVQSEVAELKALLAKGLLFDIALTNPPFSMSYSAKVPERKKVLDTYELATYQGQRRNSLRSSVMFIERYWQLLRPGGRLLTVIDDTVLNGPNFAFVRDFIRDRFIIRGIISLHGDAFRQQGSRAKTSILYLIKARNNALEDQPDLFVYESRHIGRDDLPPKTRQSVSELAKQNAEEEIDEIATIFEEYLRGEKGPWLVPSEKISDRLDAKFLRLWSVDSLVPKWRTKGIEYKPLVGLVDVIEEPVKLDPDVPYNFLKVSYGGYAEQGERALGKEISYRKLGTASTGDIVVSNINAVNGAVCVIPHGMKHLLVSSMFTVLRVKPGVKVDPAYLWIVLRSPGIKAEWLSMATGVGRQPIDWTKIQNQKIPLLPYQRQKKIGDICRSVQEYEQKIAQAKEAANGIVDELDLCPASAQDRLERAKPPR